MKQSQALNILKTGYNTFLTGPPGSGKTYVLNQYIDYLKKNNVPVAITASTGVAATYINGRTIHSWSGLGIKEDLSDKTLKKLVRKRYLSRRIRRAKVLIIDEISMLHSHQFDLVDRICRETRGNIKPFGGLQVVVSGDFFQLPPVQKRITQDSKFMVESYVWREMDVKICYLHEQHRHGDEKLTQVLNDIRGDKVTGDTIRILLDRGNKEISASISPVRLYTHNKDVDAINVLELDKIDAREEEYFMKSEGKSGLVEFLKKYCLAPERLVLKEGAKIMFVKNNFEKGYVNGTLGKVIGFNNDKFPIIKTFKGDRIIALPASWDIEDEGGNMEARITQLPLRLAWAVTVHKSQGMTLDAADIDLSKSFVEGMGYVALSRVRKLCNIKLRGINETALRISEQAILYDSSFLEESEKTEKYLRSINELDKKEMEEVFLKKNTNSS